MYQVVIGVTATATIFLLAALASFKKSKSQTELNSNDVKLTPPQETSSNFKTQMYANSGRW